MSNITMKNGSTIMFVKSNSGESWTGVDLWRDSFDELAEFNAEPDKSKYSRDYLIKMTFLQDDYDAANLQWAVKNNYLII